MDRPGNPFAAALTGRAGGAAADASAAPEPRPSPPEPPAVAGPGESRDLMHEIRARVHRRLLETLNLGSLDVMGREQAAAAIHGVLRGLIAEEKAPLNQREREDLITQVLDEIFGLGPLEPLLRDPEISDILVNTCEDVYAERHGRLQPTGVRFRDERHLRQIIDRMVSGAGRRIDESSPMVDARLPDGSRINAIIPPLAIDGSHLSIRKFKQDALSGRDLLRNGSLTEPMLRLLEGIIRARLNVLISGGTGAGKTTLLNILSRFIPSDERIITIENAAELQLQQPHVVRLESRPSNTEGQGEVSQRDLLVNALRMRPDRIIVGEVRGSEAIDMLQAMNTGHAGSIATLHANSPRDALSRLETMVMMANLNIPDRAMRQQIASAVDVVIQVTRLSDGARKVISISEITGVESDVVMMQEIFAFERQGIGPAGQVVGHFRSTGVRPNFADKLRVSGVDLPASLFSDAVTGGASW